ncbi:helix-turn-helix domain-containing protein [Streptomyces sp. D2-8]|uniref:helix-turn-helix domain-containing protein n=1 Tax=Streptomyces sp. D2-8 TaxID=2707767 RepID=UPI0020C06457|nr:helix-turn-helix domain-containing protein [Streptomyces sp. D2-8]MCK8438244.1 helix-turn-helix domain-containing protein [Streptomyces sp. D2-8]
MGTGVGITAPFGRLLRALRQSRRLTIEELAEASGVSGRAIGDMERGRSRRPHRGTITALAQGLGLDEAAHADLLAAARAARSGARSAGFVRASPHTLPRGVRDCVGRQAELAVLRALAREAAEGRGAAPPAAVVSGPPGSGKTSLAVRLAEEPEAPCPDGAFLVDMRGLDERPLPAEQAMAGLLGSWGVGDAELARLTAPERLARYHEFAAGLRGRRRAAVHPRAVRRPRMAQAGGQGPPSSGPCAGPSRRAGRGRRRVPGRARAASRVPADVRDEAHAGLAALTAGRPAPLTRFVQ